MSNREDISMPNNTFKEQLIAAYEKRLSRKGQRARLHREIAQEASHEKRVLKKILNNSITERKNELEKLGKTRNVSAHTARRFKGIVNLLDMLSDKKGVELGLDEKPPLVQNSEIEAAQIAKLAAQRKGQALPSAVARHALNLETASSNRITLSRYIQSMLIKADNADRVRRRKNAQVVMNESAFTRLIELIGMRDEKLPADLDKHSSFAATLGHLLTHKPNPRAKRSKEDLALEAMRDDRLNEAQRLGISVAGIKDSLKASIASDEAKHQQRIKATRDSLHEELKDNLARRSGDLTTISDKLDALFSAIEIPDGDEPAEPLNLSL